MAIPDHLIPMLSEWSSALQLPMGGFGIDLRDWLINLYLSQKMVKPTWAQTVVSTFAHHGTPSPTAVSALVSALGLVERRKNDFL